MNFVSSCEGSVANGLFVESNKVTNKLVYRRVDKSMTTITKPQEKHKMSEIDDDILKYFDIKKRLGKGAYGIVWKAIDKKTNQTLAVKKIFDAFRDETDAQRTFREIMFLRAFRNHPNVIQLHNVYKATNNLDIYLSFEFMESDLHNVIKKGNILKDVHKRYIIYQLLNAIKYIHSGNVIHRDLKPSNILIDTKCRCKLADFGLARSVSNQQMRYSTDANESMQPVLTDYVATRWYRAPEILVASKRYTKGIDMWSLGCILGEMIRGKPIFQGSSTVNQIEKIVTALPEITDKDILAVGAGFGAALLNKNISTNSSTITLDELLIDGSSDASNLVKRLLVLDPLARLTATEALNHKYVEKFRHSIEELELNVDVQPPFRDDIRLSVSEYRSKLYEIVQQTDKTVMSKTGSNYRKRDPRANSKSIDSTSGKHHFSEDKPKRAINRSQERKSYISIPCNDAMSGTKTTLGNGKVHIITPPTSKSGTIPKTQNITNLSTDKSRTDAKVTSMISKTKYLIKSTVRQVHNSVAKNTSSSPEINNLHRTPSRSNKPVLDKRHSIDGSCNYAILSDKSIPHPHAGPMSSKEKPTNLLHNSYCSITSLNDKAKQLSSRVRKGSQHDYKSVSPNYVDARSANTNKQDDYPVVNEGSSYYENRLKRLEEQIEKHKQEVNAYCSAKTKYSKSVILSRNADQAKDPQIIYKDKYSMVSNGSDKTLQLRSKVSGNSYRDPTKYGSSRYLYAGGDDVDHRHGIPSKYDGRKPSKII